MTQWDFQNKGKPGWTGKSSFVLEVPLRYLRPSVIYSVPCDRILQRAYCAVVARTPSLFFVFVFAISLFKGKSKYITKHLMYGPTGNYSVLFSLES